MVPVLLIPVGCSEYGSTDVQPPPFGPFGEPRAGAVRRFLEVDIEFDVGRHIGEGGDTWAGPAAELGSAGDGTIIEGVDRPSKSDRTGTPDLKRAPSP